VDVACVVGERPCLKAVDDSGFQIDEAEVIFWGTCPSCLEKNGAKEASPREPHDFCEQTNNP